jgi:hypothetical protein
VRRARVNEVPKWGCRLAHATLWVSISCTRPAVVTPPAPPAREAKPIEVAVLEPKQVVRAPCELVGDHNLEQRRAAARRAASKVRELGVPNFGDEEKELSALEASLAARTVTIGNGSVKLGSLDEQRLRMAGSELGSDAAQLLRVREELAALRGVLAALDRGEPPPQGHNDVEVELCRTDARGAWAYWVEHASFAPMRDDAEEWNATERLRVARVTLDGRVILAEGTVPSLLDPPQGDPRFIETQDPNCCYSGYSVGEPRVAFVNDQDGDGIPELAVTAEYYVEGSSARTASIFRFDGSRVERRNLDFDAVEDVDRDGRIDLIFQHSDDAGEDCDTGFSAYVSGQRYLAHAQPDGSLSFDDASAVEYSRKECPEPPRALANGQDVWCAKLYGLDPAKLPRTCAKSACSGAVTPCAFLDWAVKAFQPPLTLKR